MKEFEFRAQFDNHCCQIFGYVRFEPHCSVCFVWLDAARHGHAELQTPDFDLAISALKYAAYSRAHVCHCFLRRLPWHIGRSFSSC